MKFLSSYICHWSSSIHWSACGQRQYFVWEVVSTKHCEWSQTSDDNLKTLVQPGGLFYHILQHVAQSPNTCSSWVQCDTLKASPRVITNNTQLRAVWMSLHLTLPHFLMGYHFDIYNWTTGYDKLPCTELPGLKGVIVLHAKTVLIQWMIITAHLHTHSHTHACLQTN